MRDPAERILDLLAGKARAQVVSTAAELELADILGDDTKSCEEIAIATGCLVAPLTSLLRVLTGLGLLETPSPDTYRLTASGRMLRQSELGPFAAFVGSREQWAPWSRLREALRGNRSAFELEHGMELYGYLASHAEAARRYDRAIDRFTCDEAEALCNAYDFGVAEHVVDVGGGNGRLIAVALRRWPELRGTLFDLPHVIDAAAPALATEFPDRFVAAAGDFLDSLPSGGDHYVLKHVLHNWSDAAAVELLAKCRAAIRPDGRILVIDSILVAGLGTDMAALLDLEMTVLTGGRQRRKPEFRRLFSRAGLRLEKTTRLTNLGWLMVARVG